LKSSLEAAGSNSASYRHIIELAIKLVIQLESFENHFEKFLAQPH